MGLAHPINRVMEMLTKINVDDKNSMNSQVDMDLLEKITIDESDTDEEPTPAWGYNENWILWAVQSYHNGNESPNKICWYHEIQIYPFFNLIS